MSTTSKPDGATGSPWDVAERYASRPPVAAPLDECARLLGVPVDLVRAAARRVTPYQHADGSPRWSVFLLERELWPERFRHRDGRARRRREVPA